MTASNSALSAHQRHKREAMVQTILDTARVIMREEGVAALSMQELARRLGMRAPSLYHYFPGKMAIYDALFRLGFMLYAEQLEQAMQAAATWQEELRLSFETYMGFAIQNPELYQLCFERPVPGFAPSEESMQVSAGLLQRSYERAARWRQEIDSDLAPEQIVDLLIAMMHGLTALHLANQPGLPIGQGRFGALIPAALSVLQRAWSPPEQPAVSPSAQQEGT
jgi:AcrR family transcriptional regulator